MRTEMISVPKKDAKKKKLPNMTPLSQIKKDLYGGEKPLLKWEKGGVPSETEFVCLYFPVEFCTQSFPGTGDKELSMAAILSEEASGAKTQRNKVFNGVYMGNKMEDCALPILRAHPTFWDQIRVNCQNAILSVEPQRLPELEERFRLYGLTVKNEAYRAFLEQKLSEGELETAYASLIVLSLAQGYIEGFLEVFNGAIKLEDQYGYLDHPKSAMKRSFKPILNERQFSPGVKKVYENYSELLGYAAEITSEGNAVHFDNFLDKLYEVIRKEDDTRKLIRITGPSGAEKNAIAQLLYLRMSYDVREGRETKLAPYYIDLGKYFRDGVCTRGEAEKLIREDLRPFESFCKLQNYRIPLLFVDGLKTYTLDDLGLDYILGDLMRDLLPKTRFVIATERGVVMNPHRQKKMPQFASGRYRYEVSIESMYLFDRDKSTKYLQKFKEIYLPGEKLDLYSCLRKLGFDHVDTYQLRLLMNHLRDAENICDLYETVCMMSLTGDGSQLDAAAQWAYQFAYTDQAVDTIPLDLRQLVNTHESFLDYFIARYYMGKLRKDTAEDNVGVLPKGVTRFIVPMLNNNPLDESRLVDLIEREYDDMNVMAKSEMTYWLGRIKAPNPSERAELLLLRYYQKQKETVSILSSVADINYKRELFLLRGICVSLIVKGHREVLEYYLESLISNPLANEINRGSQLEYYGDKTYMPVYDTMDFEDDIEKGQRTLDHLMAAVDISKAEEEVPLVFELNLFTICSLLQARVERSNRGVCFDIIPYLTRVCSQIDWYLESNLCDSDMLRQYFQMVKRDFRERFSERRMTWSPVGEKIYTRYTRRVPRTDWVKRDIPEPETMAERSYHTWALGMFLLPDEYTGAPEYSKQKILDLVLMHHMAESVVMEVLRPDEKSDRGTRDKEIHDKTENDEMGIMLLRGTYPSLPSQFGKYQLWQKWDEHFRDINVRIAKELELIQGMYMLLTYCRQYPEKLDESYVRRWMSDRSLVRTIPGSMVFRTVILENQDFQPILKNIHLID